MNKEDALIAQIKMLRGHPLFSDIEIAEALNISSEELKQLMNEPITQPNTARQHLPEMRNRAKEGATLRQIASEQGISWSRVWQLLKNKKINYK